MSETVSIPSRRSVNAEAFERTFSRIVTGGKTVSLRRKAQLLDLPVSSLGHMVNGDRRPSAELVIALIGVGFTKADIEGICDEPAAATVAAKAA